MSKIIVVLDPGHGGDDRGNVGPTGYIEADGNLNTALFVRDQLLAKYRNVEVKMTRTGDTSVDKPARGKMAAGSDLFHSIHSNAGPANAKGTEVFYSVDLLHDKTFAATMSREIAAAFKTIDRGAKTKESTNYPGEDYFTVVDVAQDIGAKHVLLSESLFHSNPGEEAILKDAKNLKKIAEIIVGVYAQFLTLEPKADPVKNQASPYAQASWAKACEQGVFDWTSPQGPLTREQAAVVFDRLGLLD
jgi:N-acetylmuramoyl-L-alanine amidase